MVGQAKDDYPDFPGTPTFVLNGKMLDGVGTWDVLEPAIKAALGR
jgi:protein-disulfide isomerase